MNGRASIHAMAWALWMVAILLVLTATLTIFNQHDHNAAHNQGNGDRNRVEKELLDLAGKQHSKKCRGKKRHYDIDRESIGHRITKQALDQKL